MAYDDRIDPQQIRARVIRRLEPQLRLQRQKVVLFLHFALFVSILIVLNSGPRQVPFYIPISGSFTDFNGVVSTYTDWQMAPLVALLGLLWFGLLVAHAGWVLLSHQRERLIRREVDREYELEKMRLEIELGRVHESTSQDGYSGGKRKRLLRLADDGELRANDADAANAQQTMARSHQ